jgi:hypothetical protein
MTLGYVIQDGWRRVDARTMQWGSYEGWGMNIDKPRSRFRFIAATRLHGRLDAGNVRLSRMSRAGTVWTVDMETGEPRECDFASASGVSRK